MRMTYDPAHNIGYIAFQARVGKVRTIEMKDMNIDIAPDGSVYGIELLNAREQIGYGSNGKFIIENQETGQIIEVELPA